MKKMLMRLIGEDITLETLLSSDLGRVLVDPGQIDQVIMNLVVNARDAMPKGGTLTIETGNTLLDEVQVRSYIGSRPGAYVLLSVKDSVMEKISMSPEGKKDRITEILKQIILKGSEIRPLVMAIENLH